LIVVNSRDRDWETASGYFAKWDAKPSEVLSKFPIGEEVDLNLYSFSGPNSKSSVSFAKMAQDRVGGYPLYITVDAGTLSGVDVSGLTQEHGMFKYDKAQREMIGKESEYITIGKARVKSAKWNEQEKLFQIHLGK